MQGLQKLYAALRDSKSDSQSKNSKSGKTPTGQLVTRLPADQAATSARTMKADTGTKALVVRDTKASMALVRSGLNNEQSRHVSNVGTRLKEMVKGDVPPEDIEKFVQQSLENLIRSREGYTKEAGGKSLTADEATAVLDMFTDAATAYSGDGATTESHAAVQQWVTALMSKAVVSAEAMPAVFDAYYPAHEASQSSSADSSHALVASALTACLRDLFQLGSVAGEPVPADQRRAIATTELQRQAEKGYRQQPIQLLKHVAILCFIALNKEGGAKAEQAGADFAAHSVLWTESSMDVVTGSTAKQIKDKGALKRMPTLASTDSASSLTAATSGTRTAPGTDLTMARMVIPGLFAAAPVSRYSSEEERAQFVASMIKTFDACSGAIAPELRELYAQGMAGVVGRLSFTIDRSTGQTATGSEQLIAATLGSLQTPELRTAMGALGFAAVVPAGMVQRAADNIPE